MALAATVATLLLYLAIGFTTHAQPAPIVFLIPIVLSAYAGGLGPGLFSTVLSVLCVIYYVIPPSHSFRIAQTVDYVRLATMVIVGILISLLMEELHHSRRRAEASASDCKRAEQTIRENEARLCAILESAMDAIITVDEQQRIVLFNPAAEKMFGCSSAEALGQSLDRFIPELLRSANGGHIRGFGHTNNSLRTMSNPGLICGRRANQEEFPLEASISQVRVGVQELFTAILRDVTERRRCDETRSRLAAIVESSDDAVISKTLDGIITSWNPAAEWIFGYSAAEAVGQSIRMLIPQEGAGEEREILERISRGERVEHREALRIRKDGTQIYVSATISPIRDAAGRILGASIIARDITERKHAEKARLRSQKLEALGTLAAGITHEFNSILLAITGNAKLAASDLPPYHPAQQSLAEIAKAGARAADLVHRILAFSRPQEQQLSVANLQPAVEEALQLVRATLPAMIEIRLEVVPGLPPVAFDFSQLQQAIVNLTTNAAHALSPQGGRIDIRLHATHVGPEHANCVPGLREGSYVCLSVRDTGRGMDRATLDRIFDPFFTTKPPGGGVGLGLSIVHGIMKRHGGAVTADSEPGKGAAVHLYFPAVDGAVQSLMAAPEAPQARGKHVLYIDDEQALVFFATRLLERLGYKVTGYSDAQAALQEFRSRPREFDVVVTDLSMPGMSGFELARHLLAARPDIPIVMSSGYLRREDQEEARQMGIHGLILKPHSVDELNRTLDALFQESHSLGKTTSG